MLVILLILKLVLIVPAQLTNIIAINRNNVQQLQSFVLQNLENTLQDVNNMATGLAGHPAYQELFITNSYHQPQDIQNIRRNNLHSTVLQGSNFGSAQLNFASLSHYTNMQLSIGTIDSRPLNPGHDDGIAFNRPSTLVQDHLYHGLPKSPMFISNLINRSFKPPHTTTPMNTFAPDYATPTPVHPRAPVVNEENGNNKINDNDQVYDIDIRHE